MLLLICHSALALYVAVCVCLCIKAARIPASSALLMVLRNELARERAEKAQLFQSQQAVPRLPQTAMAPQFGPAQQLALEAPPAQPVLVQGHAGAPGDEVLGPDNQVAKYCIQTACNANHSRA